MNKIGLYLQEHVAGEVVASADARRYFSTDNSIFAITPNLVVYPRHENDVRKIARFTWQLAERKRVIPITARGAGTDQSGAAIGNGIIVAFPAHMHRVVEFDGKSGVVTVEPGINFGKLQQTLQTHGRFLPSYPASIEYSTVGGAVANNASGEKSIKYGDTREFVQSLRVVLANGEVIATGRINKRELNKKLGLSTFEGEVYRSVDALLDENLEIIESMSRDISKNSSGYHLMDVKRKDGSFDLTPLIVGSQGTLGIITEITLETESHNPETTLIVASFDSLQNLFSAVTDLRNTKEIPSAIEMVDGNLLNLVTSFNPGQFKGIISKPFPSFMLLVEYDNSGRNQNKIAKKGIKILEKYATNVQPETDFEKREILWKIRHASAAAMAHSSGSAKALPIIEDGAVPLDKLQEFITGIYGILDRNHLQVALWGHAADANLHVQPYLDLSQIGDRQKIFKILDDYSRLVIGLGGTISGEHGDGRLRAPYLPLMYGQDVYDIFVKVKKIFDPYGTLNPGVKIGTTLEDIKPLLRNEYSLNHLFDHLPRT